MFHQKTNPEEYIGKRIGSIVVLSSLGYDKNRILQFECKCDCGSKTKVCISNLKKEKTKSCRKCNPIRRRKAFGEGMLSQLICDYRTRAKKKGFEFSLTREQFKQIITSNCIYCGSEPTYRIRDKTNFGGLAYTGIDRVENNKGYTVENSVSCCKFCNTMKMNLSIDDFKKQVERIYLNSVKDDK